MKYISKDIVSDFHSLLFYFSLNEVCSSITRLMECYKLYQHHSFYQKIREENTYGQTSDAEKAIIKI